MVLHNSLELDLLRADTGFVSVLHVVGLPIAK